MGEREREGESRAEEDKAQAEGPPAALVKKTHTEKKTKDKPFFFFYFICLNSQVSGWYFCDPFYFYHFIQGFYSTTVKSVGQFLAVLFFALFVVTSVFRLSI